MSTPEEDLEDLIQRARNGCQEAATRIYHLHEAHVLRVIRRHLDDRVRRVLDSFDVLQSVWGDFFTRCLKRESIDSPGSLIALLYRIARNKVKEAHRQHLDCPKRSLHRQSALPEDVVDPKPTAEQTVDDEDQWDALMKRFSGKYREAIVLPHRGYEPDEAATLAEVPRRVFVRMVENARGLLRGRCGEPAA